MFRWLTKMDRKLGIQGTKIYSFVGCIGSGKGFKCDLLVQNEGFVKVDFADALRDMVWKMLDWKPQNAEEYDLFKKGLFVVPKYGAINGRLLLQRVGATMREIDPDFWVKQWKVSVDKLISMGYNKICVSDTRYENEIKMLKTYSWKAEVRVEFCDYHSNRYDNTNTHESEQLAQKFLAEGLKDGDRIYV